MLNRFSAAAKWPFSTFRPALGKARLSSCGTLLSEAGDLCQPPANDRRSGWQSQGGAFGGDELQMMGDVIGGGHQQLLQRARPAFVVDADACQDSVALLAQNPGHLRTRALDNRQLFLQ